jgi:hypothetical protein
MPPTGRNKGKQPMTPTTHTRPTTPAEEQATAKAEKHCPLCATVFETANPGGFALSVGNAAMGGLTRGGGWVSSLCQMTTLVDAATKGNFEPKCDLRE